MKPPSIVALGAVISSCATKPSAPAASLPNAPVASAAPLPAASAAPSSEVAVNPADSPTGMVSTALPLPGATGPASLDFIFYEKGKSRVWVPAGSTGSVDVLDVASGIFIRIEGFATAEREGHGKKRTVGPSAGAVGDGFAYIGNRATNEICPVDLATLKLGKCLKMPSDTDGVVYVAFSKEIWVTLPKVQTLAVLDASKPGVPKPKSTMKVDGAPECYAVDEEHGTFFTNLEDKGGTVAIDIKSRKLKATWNPSCGPDGPRGVAFDATHGFVIVACTDHVQVLDAAHDGATLGRLDTGAGVDNIDYVDATQLLYVAAGKAARLTVARLNDQGQLTVTATGETSEGARNAVAGADGTAYVADSQQARLLMLKPPRGGF